MTKIVPVDEVLSVGEEAYTMFQMSTWHSPDASDRHRAERKAGEHSFCNICRDARHAERQADGDIHRKERHPSMLQLLHFAQIYNLNTMASCSAGTLESEAMM